jgi:hypothetical protein
MTSKAKDSYGSEAVEPGGETQEQDRLLDSARGAKSGIARTKFIWSGAASLAASWRIGFRQNAS